MHRRVGLRELLHFFTIIFFGQSYVKVAKSLSNHLKQQKCLMFLTPYRKNLLPVQTNRTVHTVVPWAQCTPCITSVLLCSLTLWDSTNDFGKMKNAGQFWVIFAPYTLLSIDVMVKREEGKSFVQPERGQFALQILCAIFTLADSI